MEAPEVMATCAAEQELTTEEAVRQAEALTVAHGAREHGVVAMATHAARQDLAVEESVAQAAEEGL